MTARDADNAVHDTKPATDPKSKRVMLRAERGDTIAVDGHGEFNVAKRTTPYFGPKLLLYDDGEDRNYLLTAPGPDRQLLLWDAVENDEGFREGWRKIGDVTAEIIETKQYDFCGECGEPIKTADHARRAAFGLCAGDTA